MSFLCILVPMLSIGKEKYLYVKKQEDSNIMIFQVDIFALLAGVAIGTIILIALLVIIVPAVALFIAIKLVKVDKDSFGQVLLTYLLLMVISLGISGLSTYFFPSFGIYMSCVGFIIDIFVVKARHDTSFGKALGIIIIYGVFFVIIIFVILLVFLGGLAAVM